MNKKTKTKILTLSAVSALSLAAIWVLASNPNDLLFKWAVKQDAHLELSGVTLIAPTQSSDFDVSFKMSWDQLITLTGTNTAGNSVQGNGTLSFWGSNNKTSDPESLILGGSSNEIANTAKENIIAASQSVKTAGESTTNYGKGNVILASSGVNLTGIGNILRAGNSTKIHGNNNLTFATDKVTITANNSIAIGSWIQIDHDGSFVFNGTSKWETTRKANTAIIKASNGMIINANTKTADNTDLTINGSLQVGNSQIDTAGAIIYNDNCLQLKNTELGRIGLNCPNATNTESPFLSFGEVACGRNAKHYEINDRQTTWPLGSKNSDFCSKGRLDGEAPKFFDSEDRAAAYKTRGGSYASEWFGYTFHICFNEQDPTCALPKLKKSWTCSDAKGNRLHCEATQDLGKKDPKQTPVSCPSGQHLENGKCISNTKTVDCDKTWINTANGSVNTSQVAITRSESTKSWSKPAKCDFTCNTGYRKDDSNSHNIHCAKLDLRWKCWDKESGKHCVRKKIPTTYSCQWWKEAPTNCNCRLYDHSCIAKCANKPREIYICFNLPRYQCEGAEGQKRWCSWLPNLISETNSCNTYTSESSCNNDSMCNRGFSSLREEFESHNSLKRAVCMEWDNIVDDSICEENDIPNLCGNTSLDLSTTCPSGQHFENRSCESNTKTVACDATWIATTENGKTVNRAKQVQVTRSDITHSWSRPAKCDFTCATGYEERGNQCVKDTPKETEMCTYHWERKAISGGDPTYGICRERISSSGPSRPKPSDQRPGWIGRNIENQQEGKILPYTTASECRKHGGVFTHLGSARPEIMYQQICKDQKGNTTFDTSRCNNPGKQYPCRSATESPRPTPPPHPWKPETPPPRTWWNQGPPPRPWKPTTRPPRNIVAVKCDANINQLTYDGWSESLSTLLHSHDGYYAEVSSMPLDPKLNVNCWISWSIEINLAGWGMNEASIRSELGLTDNDNVSIYHCPSVVPSVCG